MDGILRIDKPKNMTSHDLVMITRKALKTKRIGHIGTLDPNATGLMVLCVGKATKLVKYYTGMNKTYRARFLIGKAYDSDDITGNEIASIDASKLSIEEIKASLGEFLGKQKQLPPNYSAIKHQGRKLYELARKDIKITNILPREIEVYSIDDFEVVSQSEQFIFDVTLTVSKGAYIRAIARDLGMKLNNCGALVELRRLKIDGFDIRDCYTLEDIKNGDVVLSDPFEYLNMQKIFINDNFRSYIDNGRFLDLDLFPDLVDTIVYSAQGQPLAIYYYDAEKNLMRMSVKWC